MVRTNAPQAWPEVELPAVPDGVGHADARAVLTARLGAELKRGFEAMETDLEVGAMGATLELGEHELTIDVIVTEGPETA